MSQSQADRNEVTLTLFGDGFSTKVSGWTSVRISRGIEHMPCDFSIAMTEQFPGVEDIVATPGMKCTVEIGSDTVVSGYVDRVVSAIGPQEHPIQIIGRGYCQDLVDCAAMWKGGQFLNQTVLTIAQAVAKPMAIEVIAEVDVGDVFPQICMQPGETAFSLISKLCRNRSLLCFENELGQLVLSQAKTDGPVGGIAQGVNVERASYTLAMDQRFSDYIVMQQGAAFFQEMGGDQALAVYPFTDPLVSRYRPKILVPEFGDANWKVAKAKAVWEMNRRTGRSFALSVTVDDWRDGDGKLWTPNTLAPIDIPALKLQDKTWLIGDVVYSRDAAGTHSELVLMPPAAFLPEPVLLNPSDLQVMDAWRLAQETAPAAGTK